MATENKLLANAVQTSSNNTPVAIYTNNNPRDTLIAAFTASNETVAKRTFKAYIVASGGTATNAQVPTTTVLNGSSVSVDKLIGHYVPPGGTLQVETDIANSIHFTLSGREFT